MNFDDLLSLPQYTLPQPEKERILLSLLNQLTEYHRSQCPEFHKLVSVLHPGFRTADSLSELPFVPVGLFKSHLLSSIAQEKHFKTLTSSGTTGQQVSQIVLDRETARRQTTALSRIMMHVLGADRLPMMLIESGSLIKDRTRFSARAAGVLGMANFGRNHFYALHDNMALDEAGLDRFLASYGDKPFLIFGFTFMVWQYLYCRIKGRALDLSNGILIHSGGWKKLQDQAISNEDFKRQLQEASGLRRVYNFYGMVEQVGSIYLEGEDGYLYPPNFSDILIRDAETWQVQPPGKPGLIQVLSILPLSYPGHSILTEDLGVQHDTDGSPRTRQGKAFTVIGRIPKAELRGCSDTHEVRP